MKPVVRVAVASPSRIAMPMLTICDELASARSCGRRVLGQEHRRALELAAGREALQHAGEQQQQRRRDADMAKGGVTAM